MRFFLFLLLVLSIYVYVYESEDSNYADNKIYDFLYKITKKSDLKKEGTKVTVVDIDEKSLSYLGQWPWSRVIISELIKKIDENHPAALGLDIIFAEPDKTSPSQIEKFYKRYFSLDVKISGLPNELRDNDEILARELKRAKVVLPVYLTNDDIGRTECKYISKNSLEIDTKNIYKNIICNIDVLQKSAYRSGFINSKTDIDGKLRRLPLFLKYEDKTLATLGLAMMTVIDKITVNNGKISILNHTFGVNSDYEILLNYTKNFHTVSAFDVLTGKVPKELLAGKFVLLGASAIGLHDRYMVTDGYMLPGVFIYASFIENILNDESIYQPDLYKYLNLIISFLFSVIFIYLVFKREYLKTLLLFVGLNLLIFVITLFGLKNGVYFSAGYFLYPLWINFILISLFLLFLYYEQKTDFNKTLNQAHTSLIDSMALIAIKKDVESGSHIKRMKEYMKTLCEYLYVRNRYADIIDKNFIELLYNAVPLYDIGKIEIPESILKKEGHLDKNEFEIIKTHTVHGKDIIKNAMQDLKENRYLKIAYNLAYYHHEKWDGSGYPQGLKGKEIPLESRLLAICDMYDALISTKCYKKAYSHEEAVRIIADSSGSYFDPTLVDIFLKVKDKFKEIATEYENRQ